MPNISKIQLPNDVVYDIADKISGYVNASGAANAAPVQSVNGQTGTVVLDAEDVGALPDDTSIPTKISDLTNDQVYDLGTRTLNNGKMLLTSEEQSDILAMWNRGVCAIRVTISDRTYMLLKEQDITYFNIPLHVFSGAWIGFDVNDNATSEKIALAVSTLTNYPIAMYASINDVLTINGQTGTVVLDAEDVGALPDDTVIPTKTSDLTNDSGFITTETDPTVPSWAKASTKPSYTASEVGALPDDTDIPSKISDLTNDQVYDLGEKTLNNGSILLTGSEAEDILAMWNRGMCALVVTVSGRTYVAFKEQVIAFSGLSLYAFAGIWSGLNANGVPVSYKVGLALNYSEDDLSFIMFALSPDVMRINGIGVDNNNNEITLTASDVGALPDDTVIPSKTSDLTNDSGFITGMTILSYGSSTWQDFLSAYNSNQVIYCRASSNSNPASGSQTRLAFMAYVSNATSPTNVEFQYYRSMSSHSATAQGDEVYVYKLTSAGTWTVTVRKASPNIVAGTGLSRSYSKDTVTLSLDGTIPTKTSDLTNDSGYITLSDLPIYDGTVIIGT